MSTKSTNIGGQGGKRPNSPRGKPPKPLKDKIEEGSKKKVRILDIPPDMEGVDMPDPHSFLSSEQHTGDELQASELYEETWNWLDRIGCAALISPQLLERYAMSMARWIQCEEIISERGFLARHPTTKAPIQSPFVVMALNYQNQAARAWNDIFQVIRDNCSTDYTPGNPQDDAMERILRARKGRSE